MKNLVILAIVLTAIVIIAACRNNSTEAEAPVSDATEVTLEKPVVPDWHRNATIYEVNLRHFTTEGTFQSFEAHIPRLKEMGIDILWLMPIHPVSVENRKGELGSPYAVGDYKEVNPDYGTMDEFKHMLQAIHDAGMYCIIDWVPNHTGWDNPWITEHPDWYTKDAEGNITDPIDPRTGEPWGWTDVADLNYDVPEMREGMIDAMAFWISEVGIDGFRVDVAHGVPLDFWETCSDSLYAIKPIFMLAEAEIPALVNSGAFVMDYGWEMHHLLNEIAKSQGAAREDKSKLVQGNVVEATEEEEEDPKTAADIDVLLAKKGKAYSKGYQMQFTSNHDENSWAATEMARMGDGHKAFAVLTATFNGMPLIYTGQESAMDIQLPFFSKGEVPWGDYTYAGFYQTLFDLKHRNQALWNGEHGGPLMKISSSNDEAIYAFLREKEGDQVVVIINLSAEDQGFTLAGDSYAGSYQNVFSGEDLDLMGDMSFSLAAWDYLVLEKK